MESPSPRKPILDFIRDRMPRRSHAARRRRARSACNYRTPSARMSRGDKGNIINKKQILSNISHSTRRARWRLIVRPSSSRARAVSVAQMPSAISPSRDCVPVFPPNLKCQTEEEGDKRGTSRRGACAAGGLEIAGFLDSRTNNSDVSRKFRDRRGGGECSSCRFY